MTRTQLEALTTLARGIVEALGCRDGHGHYCPNCDNGLHNPLIFARRLADELAALLIEDTGRAERPQEKEEHAGEVAHEPTCAVVVDGPVVPVMSEQHTPECHLSRCTLWKVLWSAKLRNELHICDCAMSATPPATGRAERPQESSKCVCGGSMFGDGYSHMKHCPSYEPAPSQTPQEAIGWRYTRHEYESWAAAVAGAPEFVDMKAIEQLLRDAAQHAPKEKV